jgi:hypothetical protein
MLPDTTATEESILSGSFVVILRERLTGGKSLKDNIFRTLDLWKIGAAPYYFRYWIR